MIALDITKSDALRRKYITRFVNIASSYYKERIERKTMFSDGLCYTGYMWDCLMHPSVISEDKANQFLQDKQGIFIMWDIHSCERILIPDYWKFPKSMVLWTNIWLKSFEAELPEDVYLFDDTFSWSIVYTHETDALGNRHCLYVEV